MGIFTKKPVSKPNALANVGTSAASIVVATLTLSAIDKTFQAIGGLFKRSSAEEPSTNAAPAAEAAAPAAAPVQDSTAIVVDQNVVSAVLKKGREVEEQELKAAKA